jgi:hypothetical protein
MSEATARPRPRARAELRPRLVELVRPARHDEALGRIQSAYYVN